MAGQVEVEKGYGGVVVNVVALVMCIYECGGGASEDFCICFALH